MKSGKKIFFKLALLLLSTSLAAQVDYSDHWEDYFSYNNVKSISGNGNVYYAVVDNSVFSYDNLSGEINKISSIKGLSGEETSTVHYSEEQQSLIIGYSSGLIEIVKSNGAIIRVPDIVNSDVSNERRINSIYEDNNELYLAMPFGIVVYDLVSLEFVDTYFIGENSSEVKVNEILVFEEKVYAATDSGVYIANQNTNLKDFNNWEQVFIGEFKTVIEFDGSVVVSKEDELYQIENDTSLVLKVTYFNEIIDTSSNAENIIVGDEEQATVYDLNFSAVSGTVPSDYTVSSVSLSTSYFFIGTEEKGMLKVAFSEPTILEEIHPDGPSSNKLFSITALNDDLWVAYGGQNGINMGDKKAGVSHFNGDNWVNIPFSNSFPAYDISEITIDPNEENTAYANSYRSGILKYVNDVPQVVLNNNNSGLDVWANWEIWRPNASLITNSIFDAEGTLWVANSWADENNFLNKMENDLVTFRVSAGNLINEPLNDIQSIEIDNDNNIWTGTGFGAFVYNEVKNEVVRLEAGVGQGGLSSSKVRSLAIDIDNKVWIGTAEGLVVFDDVDNLFEETGFQDARIVVKDEEGDGVGERLLGTSDVLSILIDGGGNKWFGTNSGGAIKTNSTGQRTLEVFNTDNSPLPSNTITRIQMNKQTGKVFFGTPNGIVAFNSNVIPHNEVLTEVYGYPNPALKQHSTISITGKEGRGLPVGANIKILDVAGNLVFEMNAGHGDSEFGGKVIWDKTNLSGNKVASGIYIVLISDEDGNQTATTKIAIIN